MPRTTAKRWRSSSICSVRPALTALRVRTLARRLRAVVVVLLLAIPPLLATPSGAQPSGSVPRIGVLMYGAPDPFRENFRRGLATLGYVEGQDLLVIYRTAGGRTERLAALADELVREDVRVIVAQATPSIQAAMVATRTIPIVMATGGDALGSGLVTSLARPEGNVTGLSLSLIELAGKTVEVLREALPRATRMACLVHADDPLHRGFLREAQLAAPRLGLHLTPVVVKRTAELDGAFATMTRERIDAVVIQPLFATDPQVLAKLVQLTLKHRIPAASGLRRFADGGGLMVYASEFPDFAARVAVYVDRLLKGAMPADLPVERPTRFQLIVNLKTARALGVTLPPALLLRADHLIE